MFLDTSRAPYAPFFERGLLSETLLLLRSRRRAPHHVPLWPRVARMQWEGTGRLRGRNAKGKEYEMQRTLTALLVFVLPNDTRGETKHPRLCLLPTVPILLLLPLYARKYPPATQTQGRKWKVMSGCTSCVTRHILNDYDTRKRRDGVHMFNWGTSMTSGASSGMGVSSGTLPWTSGTRLGKVEVVSKARGAHRLFGSRR